MAFGSAALILNKTSGNIKIEGKYTSHIGEKTKSELIDSFYTQYLLMLGHFEILEDESLDSLEWQSNLMIWLIFFVSTLITNVVFFNTLVAVIGEEYSKLWEDRIRWGFK